MQKLKMVLILESFIEKELYSNEIAFLADTKKMNKDGLIGRTVGKVLGMI